MAIERDKDLEEVYEIHRKYLIHEDDLVNQRTTWLILIQSFLMATFGFTYQKKFEVAEKLSARDLDLTALGPIYREYSTFLLTIAIVGALLAAFASISVYAAVRAIGSIKGNWQKFIEQKFADQKPPDYLPKMTGGGDKFASKVGILLSVWAPVFFFLMWFFAIFALVSVLDIRISPR